VLILAHRGASADAPENTLAAFREAAAQGADGVELDARLCGSGEVVVCHDDRLDRLAGLDWEVSRTPLWKLRQVEVGPRLGFAAAGIPLLEEVIDALPPHFLINVEIKCDGVDDQGLSVRLGELVIQRRIENRAVVSSFNPFCLWRLAAAYPQIRRGLLIDPDRSFLFQNAVLAPLLCSHSIHPYQEACTPERMADWIQRGWRVAAWTVDDPERAMQLESMGAAYCITNRPRLLAHRSRAEASVSELKVEAQRRVQHQQRRH
jgi:glycerophosphoryl diester phosphodiesterase